METKEKEVFFLFGDEAVELYQEDGFDALVQELEEGYVAFGLFHWKPDTCPTVLLPVAMAYDEYVCISEQEYTTLADYEL